MKQTWLIAIMVLVLGSLASAQSAFIGNWKSVSCELRPDGQLKPWNLTRDITFTSNSMDLKFQNYFDTQCAKPSFVLHMTGDFSIVGPSKVAEGAQEVNLRVTKVSVIPSSPDFAGFLNSAKPGECGKNPWQVGIEQTITDTGCSLLGVGANQVTVEYEILYRLNNFLFFGARPIDGTFLTTPDKRPSALLVPLVRK